MNFAQEQSIRWPRWRKIIFRFLFVYLTLTIRPWGWFSPGQNLFKFYGIFWRWLAELANKHLFHIKNTLMYSNGSGGDTSFSWAGLWLALLLSLIGCIIWSAIDFKRKNYIQLNYWLCLFARYFLILNAMVYGIDKLFAMQMVFPNLHQLATPLGDFLPMRLSWLFIGYSTPYQVFSGVMEVVAGLLLLYRRTTTLGIIIATGVFINVMMLNFCYDIPVKIFSTQLVFICLFLLANESNRLLAIFVLNKPAPVSNIYQFSFSNKYLKIGRIIFKTLFVIMAVGIVTFNYYSYYKRVHQIVKSPIPNGIYNVAAYVVNNKPVNIAADTLAWQDFILDNDQGSIKTGDTTFRRQYNRAYFEYSIDSLNRNIDFKRTTDAGTSTLFTMHYQLPDSNTIELSGKKGADSLKVELKRSKRHFQLTEPPFHWITEYKK
ncbi:hypothetical protein [Mucilaginibacter sp. dw_454]|uniref:hypothetical protein n=1 Tax=Mucilaginibacter sp. dw_454 TaxID=2720079 RepID=UPI001BD2E2CD|nr:hypothetical protein [Mucilaginibacter sp. dw_454]